MNPYRARIWEFLKSTLPTLDEKARLLDFGSGDGWFASMMAKELPTASITPLDVKRREAVLVEPLIHDPSKSLPFGDREFDLVYAVDVLHHCEVPANQLRELIRVADKYILLKDHNYTSFAGKATLALLDELGNKKFGTPSLYQYQQNWNWESIFNDAGWVRTEFIHPLRCHVGPLGWATNQLQYLSLYKRQAG